MFRLAPASHLSPLVHRFESGSSLGATPQPPTISLEYYHDRGYLAAAASRLSLWWHGASRPQGLTADTESGAGLQARDEGEDQPPNGDAIPAPPADGYEESDPDHGFMPFVNMDATRRSLKVGHH